MAHQYSFQAAWSWLVRHWRDLLQFGWPFALFETFNWIYDKLIFSYTILEWGPFWGSVIPTLGAFAVNAFVFWLYDRMKVDWLKAHAMRQLADEENLTNFQKIVTWHHKPRTTLREKVIGELRFVMLLVLVDPVIVSVYYRDNHFNGVKAKDWLLLAKATLIACLVWAPQMAFVAYAARYIWHLFAGVILFTIPIPFLANGLPVTASFVAALVAFVVAYQVVTRVWGRIFDWLSAR